MIQVKNLRDQKEEYHNERMDRNEQPSLFIVKLKSTGVDVSWLQQSEDGFSRLKTRVFPTIIASLFRIGIYS